MNKRMTAVFAVSTHLLPNLPPDFGEPQVKSLPFSGLREGAGRESKLESAGERRALEQKHTLFHICGHIHIAR